MCMVQRAQRTAYLNAEQWVSGGRGGWRHKCTLTKGCATIHGEGYFWLKWHWSGAGSHSHATKDGPDCLKFYANDTCLSESSRFPTPRGGQRDLEFILHPVVHLSLLVWRLCTITTADIYNSNILTKEVSVFSLSPSQFQWMYNSCKIKETIELYNYYVNLEK